MKKNKKLLFIFPNTANSYALPSAVALLCGIAKRLGWKVEYFDTCIYQKQPDSMQDRQGSGEFKCTDKPHAAGNRRFQDIAPDLQEKINIFAPDVIAISCMSFEYQFLLSFLPGLNILKETVVVIGGIHAILAADEAIMSGFFDLVCIGEGEETFSEILAKVEKKEDISKIKNTYFKDKISGLVVKNPRNRLIKENKLWETAPDYSLFNENYFLYPFDGRVYQRFNFETARGCPYSCAYCGNSALQRAFSGMGKFIRVRSIESIKSGLSQILSEYGIELFYFEDECFLSHPVEWLEEFAHWYGDRIKKPFIIQTRPETVTEEKIELFEKMNAPFFQVSMGVESGSEKILFDVCNRKTSIRRVEESFALLHKHNIRTCAFFMVGFPYETREDIFKSIALCRRIKPSVVLASIFQPMPGQKLRQDCIEHGFIKGNEPLPTFTGKSILNMPQISAEEIMNLRRVFALYATLPEKYYADIEKCEKDYESNRALYDKLVGMRWNPGRRDEN